MPACTGSYPCCITYNNSGLDNACDCYTQAFLSAASETCQGEQAGVAQQHPGATIVTACPP
jgi:hypothetical protein